MNSQELYQRLIADLEKAKAAALVPSLKKKLSKSLQPLGSFLYGRSLVFEILHHQDNVDVFLSMCRANMKNLILVFDYFLSGQTRTSTDFLLTILNSLNKEIAKINKAHLARTYKISGHCFQLSIAA